MIHLVNKNAIPRKYLIKNATPRKHLINKNATPSKQNATPRKYLIKKMLHPENTFEPKMV